MKYGNKKVQIDRYIFDSTLEAKRYRQLALLERAGEISNLQLQVPFLLQESFRKNGKTYRKIEYIADFVYEEKRKDSRRRYKRNKNRRIQNKEKII